MRKYIYALVALTTVTLYSCYDTIKGRVSDYVEIKPENGVYQLPADGKTLLPMEVIVKELKDPDIDIQIGANAGRLITSDFQDTAAGGSIITMNLRNTTSIFYLLLNPDDIDRQKVFFYMIDNAGQRTEFTNGITILRSFPNSIRIETTPNVDSLEVDSTLNVDVYVWPVPDSLPEDHFVTLRCFKPDSIPSCQITPSSRVAYGPEGKASFQLKANADGLIKLVAEANNHNGTLRSDTAFVRIKQ